MKKYNKDDIKKSLKEAQEFRKYHENAISTGDRSIDTYKAISSCKDKERLLNLELAVAELQEKAQ